MGANRLFHLTLRGGAIEARQVLLVGRRAQRFDCEGSLVVVGGRGRVGGIEPPRLGVILQRAVPVALAAPCRAAVVVGALKLRIQFQCRIVVRNGAAVVLQRLIGVAAVGQEFCLGTNVDRLVVIGDCAGVIAIAGQMQPAIVEEFRLRRIDPDRRTVVLKRALAAAKLAIGRGAVGVGPRPVRFEADRFVVIGDRLLILALEIPGGAAVGKRLREIRLEPQRLIIVLDGAIVFAGIVEGVAAILKAGGIVRLEPDGLVQRFERSLSAAGLAKNFAPGAKRARTIGVPGYDG